MHGVTIIFSKESQYSQKRLLILHNPYPIGLLEYEQPGEQTQIMILLKSVKMHHRF